ncbi:hypothetical protein L484_020195 [Morus notabilis]|uniref:Uncharacterized protein n=1 Tax=Morus notabilis TaxID=981085 RepID=W9QN64_9ROSA|nr:hypothetical protein L484_020195 [Morus notabilis]
MYFCFIHPYFPLNTQMALPSDRAPSSRANPYELPAFLLSLKVHLEYYSQKVAELETQTAYAFRCILEIQVYVEAKISQLESKLASSKAELSVAYIEIQCWRDLYYNLRENVVDVPIYTQPSASFGGLRSSNCRGCRGALRGCNNGVYG